jgi:cation-dependent mannose-6-phosphate receptor
MVLNYTSGSPCSSHLTKNSRSLLGDDENHDGGKNDDKGEHKNDDRRKSSIISFQCERDALAPKVHLSFVGASQDECTYFFEARTMAACGGVNETEQTLGPGGIFGVMYAHFHLFTRVILGLSLTTYVVR